MNNIIPLMPLPQTDPTACPHEIYWLFQIMREFKRATAAHGAFNSAHEGYAVLLEETDELWDEIKKKNPDLSRMQEEAVQVAAMALRFIVDITDDAIMNKETASMIAFERAA